MQTLAVAAANRLATETSCSRRVPYHQNAALAGKSERRAHENFQTFMGDSSNPEWA